MRERILEKGVPNERVILFEPRADEALLGLSPLEGTAFRTKYSLEGKFIVSHSGNLGVKQGLDVMLRAASLCCGDDTMTFLLVGNGAAKEGLQKYAAQLQLNNVRFLPLLDASDFRGLLAATDVSLVIQKEAVSDIVFPSKVVTYLSAGCAVVASVNAGSEVAQAVTESRCGIVVEPENAEALLDAVYQLRKGNLAEYRQFAREYAGRRWAPSRVLGALERSLQSVCGLAPVSLEEQEIRQ